MSLYHPDRFAHEPDKLATYEKLTAAINHAKDRGDIETLRQIATIRTASFCGRAGPFSTSARRSR